MAEVVIDGCEKVSGGVVGIDAVFALGSEHGMFDFDYNFDGTYTPLEIGAASSICWTKPRQFQGQPALQKQARDGVTKRLVMAVTHDMTAVLNVGDNVCRDGEICGAVVTVDSGFHVGALIAAVRVGNGEPILRDWLTTGAWTIGLEHVPVTVSLRALHDSNRSRSTS